jgi:thiol-disulfide isomerase/thioredoxin
MKYTMALMALLLCGAALAQEKPQRVAGKLPEKALCLICSEGGESELEKPAGAVAYKGKTYYFCNKGEISKFLKDPETYIPALLPRSAPNFTLKTPSGESLSLDSLKGKVILVDFWATWCKPCIASMPDIQKFHEKYQSKGLVVLGISIDDDGPKKVVPFLAKSKTKFTYPILLDPTGTTWKAWGVKIIPFVALVKDGQIVAQWSGTPDPKILEKAIVERL